MKIAFIRTSLLAAGVLFGAAPGTAHAQAAHDPTVDPAAPAAHGPTADPATPPAHAPTVDPVAPPAHDPATDAAAPAAHDPVAAPAAPAAHGPTADPAAAGAHAAAVDPATSEMSGANAWDATWIGAWEGSEPLQVVIAGGAVIGFSWGSDHLNIDTSTNLADGGPIKFIYPGGEAVLAEGDKGELLIKVHEEGKEEMGFTLRRQ